MEINDALRDQLSETALEAIGHFFCGWGEDSAPRILAPYKYGYCEKQHGTAYIEISEYLFDIQFPIADLLEQTVYGEADIEFIDNINTQCDLMLAAIDAQ
jgi:hypothetical protein